jgi:hypothetical protein
MTGARDGDVLIETIQARPASHKHEFAEPQRWRHRARCRGHAP